MCSEGATKNTTYWYYKTEQAVTWFAITRRGYYPDYDLATKTVYLAHCMLLSSGTWTCPLVSAKRVAWYMPAFFFFTY